MYTYINRFLQHMARYATTWSGSNSAFGIAFAVVIVWVLSGPFFQYSDTWQLVINTGTTVVTFLMVFLIQRSQNRDSLAVQLKLNELLAALQGASNRLIDAEEFSEEELKVLRDHYATLAELCKKETDIGASHSIDEAYSRHELKR